MSLKVLDNLFYIETANTSYAFCIRNGFAEHLYYGAKIPFEDCLALEEKRSVILVNTLYPKDDPAYSFDVKSFEFSLSCRGDSRSSSVCLCCDEKVFDFVYAGYETGSCPQSPLPMPSQYDESVTVRFEDKAHSGAVLSLVYLVNYAQDVIVRYVRLDNGTDKNIRILKFASAQTDMSASNKRLVTFHGAWGREMSRVSQPLTAGKYTHGSYSGMSSAECNPLFFVADTNADENDGEVYAFNLMYSASHEISAEVTPYGGLRILHGIQSENLSYDVAPGGSFVSPCSVCTFSSDGFNGASHNLHDFVNNAVVAKRPIPVMLNTWEAVYFDMDENKMKSLADKASQCGFECLVIDDGWFVGRNDDTTSLGDWYEDKNKFPSGLRSLSEYFASKGLMTGIWIEPEMISEDSDLFRSHPEFALRDGSIRPVVGRGQYILDMTNKDVRKHVEESVARLVAEYGAGYVKWDFNRRFAEIAADKGSGYFYDYVCGLYGVLKNLNERFPDLIIENCASGGGRFDLGMARYTACGWASDNTNPLSRSEIQQGVSYGYPLSFTLNHVAASPGHQTKRASRLEDRINTALPGIFGVQADITKMSDDELTEIKQAIKFYKENRELIKNCDVYRITTGENGYRITQYLSKDKKSGFLYIMRDRFYTVTQLPSIRLKGLYDDKKYIVEGPCTGVCANGATLKRAGLVLAQNYQGAGETKDIMMLTDASTAFFTIKIKE